MDFVTVFKFNPYHASDGRFSDKHGNAPGSTTARTLIGSYPTSYNEEEVIHSVLSKDEAEEYKRELEQVRKEAVSGKSTYQIHAQEGKDNSRGKFYTPERRKLHAKIIKEQMAGSEGAIPSKGEAPVVTILGGRPGSGKSTFEKSVAAKHGTPNGVYEKSKNVVVDPDEIKLHLYKADGHGNGSKATTYHDESSHIAHAITLLAKSQGKNVVIDKSMSGNQDSLAHAFRKAGYKVNANYLAYSPLDSAKSSLSRWKGKKGVRGRLAPVSISLDSPDNEKNFDSLRKYSDTWHIWSRGNNGITKLY